MNGLANFRLLMASILTLSSSAQDLVTLNGGQNIRGKILSLGKEIVAVDSPHSSAPLKIKGTSVRQLEFQGSAQADLPRHSEQITLINGDVFPAEVLSLDETHLQVETWFAGPLSLPRKQLRSVHYGMKPQTLLYSGLQGLDDWNHQNDWSTSEENGLTLYSTNTGSINRTIDYSESFIFQTTIRWQNTPNISFYLAADSQKISNCKNAYRFTLGNQGIQVDRLIPLEQPRPNFSSLGDIRLKPSGMPKKLLNIEARVNRPARTLQIYLDGILQKTFGDQAEPPAGTHLIVESRSSGHRTHELVQLRIMEWDTKTQKLHREGPVEDPSVDTLSLADGDRYSGEILSIKAATEDNETLTMRSPLIKKDLEIPTSACSVLHFRKAIETPAASGTFGLALINGGTLGLQSIQLGSQLKADHPLLGELSLDRRILSQITRHQAEPLKETP